MTKENHTSSPDWLIKLRDHGLVPYIATSQELLSSFNTKPFGQPVTCFTMENPQHSAFLEAYLLSNALSFKMPGMKMPHWVLMDCVLMQSAVIGFMKARDDLPETFLDPYRKDPAVDLDRLDYIPISGQISSPAIDKETLVGFSLFSLAKETGNPNIKRLGLYTKALAFEVYRAASYKRFRAISYYNSPVLRTHGRFGTSMELSQPLVPMHTHKDMALLYEMQIDFDPFTLDEDLAAEEPTFWLNAKDLAGKMRMQDGIKDGKRYFIMPPFSVKRDGEIFLPIKEEKS